MCFLFLLKHVILVYTASPCPVLMLLSPPPPLPPRDQTETASFTLKHSFLIPPPCDARGFASAFPHLFDSGPFFHLCMKTQKGRVVAREVRADEESLGDQILVTLGAGRHVIRVRRRVCHFFPCVHHRAASCAPIYLLRAGVRVRQGREVQQKNKTSLKWLGCGEQRFEPGRESEEPAVSRVSAGEKQERCRRDTRPLDTALKFKNLLQSTPI